MKQRLLTLLCLLCCLSASTAWAETYSLVTDATQLNASDNIIIVAKAYDFAMSNVQNTSNRGQAAVTKTGNDIELPSASTVQIITLEKSTIDGHTDQWLFNVGTDGYLYAASSSSNQLKTQKTASANACATISIATNGVATIKFQGTNSRNLLKYNSGSSLFSCYSSGQQDICIYKKTGSDPVKEKVKTPTFSPAGGEFTEAQNVTIACETEGATIYYTTNGEDPATTSAIYSDPIEVNATTTIKAIAVKTDMDDSEIATATYTIKTLPTVTSIEGLKALPSGTKAILNLSDAVVTGVTSGATPNVFIQDAKGGIELYKYTGAKVKVGDHISGTITGTYNLYNGMPEVDENAIYDLQVAEGKPAEPTVVKIDDLVAKQAAYIGKLIKIENASYANGLIAQEGTTNTVKPFDTFMTLPTEWPETFDITGVCIIYKTTLEIAPRSEADIVQKGGKITPTLSFDPVEVTAYLDALDEFSEPEFTIEPSELKSGVTYSIDKNTVATIDASTGNLEILAEGTAEVTAAFAGDGEYKAATATYTLKVVANKPNFVMLVAKAHDGRYYAMSSNKGVVDNSLKAIEVNVDNNRVYIENISDFDNSLLWLIEPSEKEGEDFIKAFDGSYLAGTSGNTNLITKIKTQANSWLYDNADNCWKIGGRSFLFKEKYSDDKPYPVFRNYSTNNLDSEGYAATYTIAMPYGPLFNVHEGTSTEGLMTNEIVVDGENYKANKIKLFDNVDYKLEHAVEANEVEYSRLLTSTTWTTICLPFDVPEAACGDYDVLQIFGAADDAIVFEYASAMVKHTPYLIKKKDSFTDRNLAFDITGTIIVDATTDEAEAVVDDVKLVGIYEAQLIPVDGKSYGISGGEFKRPSATNKNKLNAYRAYLQFIDAAQAEMLKIKVNDGTEGIGTVVNDVEDGVFYDLYGRKVNNPTTGIYIFNGTKVYVK